MKTQNNRSNADKMPVVFIGHGSPMNAIEDNEFSQAWMEIGALLPKPEMILCVSAHWETNGTYVTAMANPQTIYDFYGFPDVLYRVSYPAPGSPAWADTVQETISQTEVRLNQDWGLDHGSWSVLRRLFPQADIPVLQLSLDRSKPADYHYRLGRELASLRAQGVLIVGSGNIVHNLHLVEWSDTAFEWAEAFDRHVADLILKRDHAPLANYTTLGAVARLAIPTNEHYLPLLYTLALQDEEEEVQFFADKVTLGSISMRSLVIGM